MKIYFHIATLTILILNFSLVKAQKLERVLDLSGSWQFSIGDDMNWAEPNFNDSYWESIRVPDQWESQGFNGYDGFAWYRKRFQVSNDIANMPLYLSLGYIDDVDEVYLNGVLIGRTGTFPDFFSTAYNAKRIYSIPGDLVNREGENTIAIRVFDEGGEGGIIHGQVAIMVDVEAIPVDMDFQGSWYFRNQDIDVVANNEWNFSRWDKIIVPGIWEDQGYKDYDGVATYALMFDLENEFKNQDMVLLLGRIDDLDKVYLNGELIGSSGPFNKNTAYGHADMHKQLRGYYIPDGILIDNGQNVLIVKVLDTWGVGGIYEGTVGLITQENYINYWRSIRSR